MDTRFGWNGHAAALALLTYIGKDEVLVLRRERLVLVYTQHASDEKYNFERLQRETVLQHQKLLQWVEKITHPTMLLVSQWPKSHAPLDHCRWSWQLLVRRLWWRTWRSSEWMGSSSRLTWKVNLRGIQIPGWIENQTGNWCTGISVSNCKYSCVHS